ncbi:BrnT family toxin [Sphingoaurantiacus capsulatus]|uniref:BrnT family toxin n=1 Tax=Sphingoaurantiacus capsulatus TaxID=1771310 RepID=A0ABV7XA02_9SPHN
MEIAFDPAKRKATLEARGLDFADAAIVFDGATYTMVDDREEYGEERCITVGRLNRRMVVIVWTPRDGFRRIISMRKANDREQAFYAGRLG